MTFGDYMNSLPTERISEKRRKMLEIAEACYVSETQVFNWVAGRATPDALKRKVISGIVNIPVSELFPNV